MSGVHLSKRGLPRALRDVPPPEVATAVGRPPVVFGQLGFQSGDSNLTVNRLLRSPGQLSVGPIGPRREDVSMRTSRPPYPPEFAAEAVALPLERPFDQADRRGAGVLA